MRSVLAAIRRGYGASPAHLLGLLACFALVGYLIIVLGPAVLWNDRVWWQSTVVWFFGALLLHDLVLFPLYTLADRLLRRMAASRIADRAPVNLRNYLRLPTLGSGLLLAMFFPGIIQQGQKIYHAATGQTQDPYLERWLLITVAMFAVSGLIYLVRVRRGSSRVRRAGDDGGPGKPNQD